jgi:pimeloyl-ACP methyl ester carboxylesterase
MTPPRDALPRRAFLGAQLAPDGEAFSEQGVLVAGVAVGSMVALAGVEAGDRLVSVAGSPLRNLCEMAFALRDAGRESEVEIVFQRAGQRLAKTVATQSAPREVIEGQEVNYEQIESSGALLRSIVTMPLDGKARAAILFLQGIACESIDYGVAPDEPIACLIHGWASAGYLTMRVEKRGVGDSEGAACPEADFETELADHRAALAQLAADPRARGLELFVFGHSIGGMVAPILASERALSGLMVYGSSTRNWLDCVVASTRRQYEMRGLSAAKIEEILGSLRDRVAREGLNGRSAAYHRQLEALDLPAVWRQVKGSPRVLVLCGEHDWVLSHDEQMEIAKLMERSEGIDLPGLDHMLGWHASREDSMSAYGQGHYDPAILQATLEWLERSRVQ